MPVGQDFNLLLDALNATSGPQQQPVSAPVASEDGRDMGNQLALLAGQLAGAIAPGSMGAALGQIGTELGQAKIAEQSGKTSQQAFLESLQGLTGDGVSTTGVTVGDDGTLKITGTQAPTENIASQETIQTGQNLKAIPDQPVAQGGQAGTANPFLESLKR